MAQERKAPTIKLMKFINIFPPFELIFKDHIMAFNDIIF